MTFFFWLCTREHIPGRNYACMGHVRNHFISEQTFISTKSRALERNNIEKRCKESLICEQLQILCQGSPLPLGRLGKTSWTTQNFIINRPHTPGRSQIVEPSVGMPFQGKILITTGETALKPSAANTHSFSIRQSTLEKDFICAVNVGNLLAKTLISFNIREFTLK